MNIVAFRGWGERWGDKAGSAEQGGWDQGIREAQDPGERASMLGFSWRGTVLQLTW